MCEAVKDNWSLQALPSQQMCSLHSGITCDKDHRHHDTLSPCRQNHLVIVHMFIVIQVFLRIRQAVTSSSSTSAKSMIYYLWRKWWLYYTGIIHYNNKYIEIPVTRKLNALWLQQSLVKVMLVMWIGNGRIQSPLLGKGIFFILMLICISFL
jgi:hypothetical protein